MARALAIDYGLKRTGIAVTDPLRIIATSLETIASERLFEYLKIYFGKETVDTIVVGDPLNLDGTPAQISKEVNSVIEKLKKTFPEIQIVSVDERFTSKIATQAILNSGISKKRRRDKSLVDKISAVVILQSYLESKS